MDAGLTLNVSPISSQANHSSDTITVFCKPGCGDALPEDKLRRDSLQPRSPDKEKERAHTRTNSITETFIGLAGSKDEVAGQKEEKVAEEFLKSFLLSDPTIGAVVHDTLSTFSEQPPFKGYASRARRETLYSNCHPVPKVVRSERTFVRYSKNHLINSSSPADSHMYSLNSESNNTSELAARKALTSFMKLASVCPVLPDDVGAALNASSSTNEEREKRNSAFEERVACNQYTFAFGGSMDPNQSLKTGLQLRKRKSNDSSKKGTGIGGILSEEEVNMSMKSSQSLPEVLPVRKASLQRDQVPLDKVDVSLKGERKLSRCSRLKKKFCSFAALFKPRDSAKDLSCSPHFSDPRNSNASFTSTASSRSKKTVRFQDRVPKTFEPAFLSAPVGAASDRKSVLNSQFGQIQYNSNAGSLNHSNSAPNDAQFGGELLSGARPVRTKSDPLADLHTFPSFAEARTGIYQRLKRHGKDKTELKMAAISSTEILPSVTLTNKNTSGDVVPASKSVLPDFHTAPRSLRYMDVDEFEEHKVDTI